MSAQKSMVPRSAGSWWATRGNVAQTLSHMTGSARRRFPYLSLSPTRILALRLQRKRPRQREHYEHMLRSTAKLTNERLPVMTFQRLLRQEDLQDEKGLSDIISKSDPAVWRDRINSMERRGWLEADLDHWVWILTAETPDARVARFVSTDARKPLFILTTILQSGQTIRSADSLKQILDYITKHYCMSGSNSSAEGSKEPRHDPQAGLTYTKFLLLLRRLVHHIQKVWPRAIVSLSQLTRSYIQHLPANEKHHRVYWKRCRVFNTAITLFSKPAPVRPMEHMDFNWRAQRILLSMSDAMDRPLIIDHLSYRAIRKVMVSQRKSAAERQVAMRYAASWPPYRQDFDGLDTKRTPEDDQSRSVKAGVVMTEAGYETHDYDRALGALGGSSIQSPTIQTRSLPPKEWKDKKEGDNFFTYWAMKVRSTRNNQEAWRAFTSFTDVEPTVQVYNEMFLKLQARSVDSSRNGLPGDSREVLPVRHDNFSEYELARLTPPTVNELYQHMVSRGVKPERSTLQHLVPNARSVEDGLQYLRGSGLDAACISHLTLHKAHNYGILLRIPVMVFKSYIQLLCRLQPDRRGNRLLEFDELFRINQAVRLAKIRFAPDTPEGATFRPVWQIICRALARPYVAVVNAEQLVNDMQALDMFLDVHRFAERAIGLDPEIFIFLCRTVVKVAVSHLDLFDIGRDDEQSYSPAHLMQGTTRLGSLFQDAQRTLRGMFVKMVTPVSQPFSGLQLPQFIHDVTPVHLHVYMRALAFLEDVDGMVKLLDWVFRNKDFVGQEADRIGNRGHLMIAKTLCAFEAFAGPHLQTHLRDELDTRMGRITEADPSWRWPSSEDLEAYIRSDQTLDAGEIDSQVQADYLASQLPRSKNIVVELPQSTLNIPKSVYSGFTPPAPLTKEWNAVTALLELLRQKDPDLGDFIEFELSDFTIYLDGAIYPNEMRPLQHLATRMASDKFYFDGTVSVGETKFFLRKIPFRELPIGNYDVSEDSIHDQIWIRSEFFQKRNKEIYYKLGKPAIEYSRFHIPFLWIADLAKHVVDYCAHLHTKRRRAVLHDFRSRFSIFLFNRHRTSAIFRKWHAAHGSTDLRGAIKGFITSIQPGDVISTPPDGEGTDTKWKREVSAHHESDPIWYALVQQVHISRGRRSFDVIWMYEPRDTPCALMKYPWAKELFLSDSCTCGEARVDEKDVLSTHAIQWFGHPSTSSTSSSAFFVRQTYLADKRCWVSLKEEHMSCNHQSESCYHETNEYRTGDTVLAKATQPHLEVFVVDAILKERERRWARLRRLLRRSDIDNIGCAHIAVNELVYSDQLVELDLKRIVRRCQVRAYRPDEKIMSPYDRNGTGDTFFLTLQAETSSGFVQYIPIEDPTLLHFRQGFDPSHFPTSQKLRGLDLFCGGGNFGRGLEDGGGIQMKWANDISTNAIHTYMANCRPEVCTPYLGSVDGLLYRAIMGKPEVPQPGDVQFISGGSPCQGFSLLTADKDSNKQWKNRSLVASFASFVDFYRPQYGLLENVTSMVKVSDKHRRECFFSQLICAIVGLGYQVRIVYADAWSYGTPQSRCRVFLCFAAPGLHMPEPPTLSHSHPSNVQMGKLGLMSNGQPFGERLKVPTPFKFVSALEATSDLPDIRDGKADYCVGFPDHRIAIGFTPKIRTQLRYIPTQPWGMDYSKAYFGYSDSGRRVEGTLSTQDRALLFPKREDAERLKKESKGWGRVLPNGLFHTVVTRCSPTDRRTGTVNHWQQPRPLTVLEVRRAQGFLDHELILGGPREQWHIVGNSVARQVSLAFGLAFREAWSKPLDETQPIHHQPIIDLTLDDNEPVRQPVIDLTLESDPLLGIQELFVQETPRDVAMAGDSKPMEPHGLPATPKDTSDSTHASSIGGDFDEPFSLRTSRKRRTTSKIVALFAKRARANVVGQYPSREHI
ncbi:hypothetical protein BJ170DRAFT_674546 [Xylariales sp. AK1849]|nr:hypothetical protein BJ170DRAFT_674546 [Xylariales sp. AK1849]